MTSSKVTLRDIYNLSERIDDKLDRLDAQIDGKLDKIHERLTSLENWRSNIMGKMAILFAMVSFAVSFALNWLRERIKI